MTSFHRLFIACYAASGAAALVYQVAWTRLFSLQLGHTTAASSTVLAAFMGGLAAGAWMGGRVRTDVNRRRLLLLYAAIEALIAAIAIALPGTLQALVPSLAWAYADGASPTFFAFVRVAISLVLVGVPAAAMGATFPIAVAWLADATARARTTSGSTPAAMAGALYAANTAGAAVGAIGAGFWLIPAVGLRATTWIGIALNVAAALGALWIARQPTPDPTRKEQPRRAAGTRRRAVLAPRPALACAAAALSGFLSLVYEVSWTRLLALVLGPTTYAFAAMAASFITGIAMGSYAGSRLVRRVHDPASWLGGMLVATAVSAPAAAWVAASRVPMFVASEVNAGTPFASIIMYEALAVALLLLPTGICLGATFVVAVATASPETAEIGRDSARVYAANTVGAVAGALSAGFVLIPRLGLQSSFVEVSRVGAIGGIIVAMLVVGPRTIRRALVGALMIVVVTVAFGGLPDWDRQLLSSGAYKYSRNLDAEALDASLRAGQLEYYEEGAAGTVSVRSLGGSRSLAIDGKVDASNAGDMLTQRLLGLLPTLLHPDPREALVIGLGSGVTADAVLASGEVQRLDIVEISPEVVDASAYFVDENRGVLSKSGVRLLIADGRSHLRLSARQYDVIVSEPSNPWMAGLSALFTREFFEAARARLRPGGVFCQWAHTYEIAEADLQSIVRTFASAFPEATMWLVGDGDLLLIGTNADDMGARVASLPRRWQKGSVPALLTDVAIPPDHAAFILLSLFAGGPAELAAYGGAAIPQTDDRMSLEFTAARAMYAPPDGSAVRLRAIGANAVRPAVVDEALIRASAADWTARGRAGLRATAFGMAHESFRRAVALDSRSAEALRGSSDAAEGRQAYTEEAAWLRALVAAEPDNGPARVELSHVLAALGQTDEAISAALDAARIDPARAEPLEQLASVVADVGDAARLAPLADELVRRFPRRDEGQYFRAAALFLQGRHADADAAIQALLGANPRHAKGQNLRGVLCAQFGNYECARTAFETAMRLSPRDPSVYVNLGFLHLGRGDAATATRFFNEALAIDTSTAAARQGLAEARAAITAG